MEAHRYDAIKTIETRPFFYRKLYRGLLQAVLINSVIISLLCVVTTYLGFYGFKPEHDFTTSESGHLLELRYSTTPIYPTTSTESPPANGQPAAPAPAR